ncbi:MAG TPA: tetratricopeptide repeat protein [Rhizomicrobium sp.]|nr:tetratricopeptide repeat protein [Rhizomicrobium sp.]
MSDASDPRDFDAMLAQARHLLSQGRNEEAYAAYVKILNLAPSNRTVLHELGALAYADGYRSAARTVYTQIVHNWPDDLAGRVNLGLILYEDGDLAGARPHFGAALKIDPASADAHRGLGRIFCDAGETKNADWHWRKSFDGQAIVPQNYRGKGPGVPILLLVSARGGNIPTHNILDNRIFAVTALYTEYYKPEFPLPHHAIIFNAIGDADFCPAALDAAEMIVERARTKTINIPTLVRRTGRAENATRLADIPGVRAPHIRELRRAEIDDAKTMAFPILLRSKGFHTGQHFMHVENEAEFRAATDQLPGNTLLAIEYLDARGADGMARKCRVMYIGGQLYPIHLAISADWKVHYFTADMAANAAYREEEREFLEDMPAILGTPAIAALKHIGEKMDLDYCGIDFALARDGRVLVFEANATMVINPPPPEPIWDYRRAPAARALNAAKELLL